MAFALKARRHSKHTLDHPPYIIDTIHCCVLFIPFGQIFPCGHMDNYDPMVTVIYLHLCWSCIMSQNGEKLLSFLSLKIENYLVEVTQVSLGCSGGSNWRLERLFCFCDGRNIGIWVKFCIQRILPLFNTLWVRCSLSEIWIWESK